jgi:hypothetical protein
VSVVDAAQRLAIEERAAYRCEYCRLPMQGQIATFPVDHLLPRSLGGESVLPNLALACPHCNGHKWAHTSATDPETQTKVPLYNPRVDHWEDHFRWSSTDITVLEGITARGRATIALLQMNHDNMVEIRRLWCSLHIFPSVRG